MNSPQNELRQAVEKLISLTQEQKNQINLFLKEDSGFGSKVRNVIAWIKNTVIEWWKHRKAPLVDLPSQRKQIERLRAVELIKMHYLLIEKLQEGSVEDKKLASLATEAIQQHNQLIETTKKLPTFWKKQLVTIDELISLPRKATHAVTSVAGITSSIAINTISPAQKQSKKASRKIDSLKETINSSEVGKAAEDLFRMKVIRALNENALLPIHSTFSSVHKTPIKQFSSDESAEAGMTLGQSFSPLPGEEIEFVANYNDTLYPTGQFSYALSSHQTGFPDPILSWGWALTDSLMPKYPLRLEQIEGFRQILDKKAQIAHALLPKGSLNSHAKQLLLLKRNAFEKKPLFLIDLHEVFFTRLANAESLPALKEYFSSLKTRPGTYEQLAAPYQEVNQLYLNPMHERIVNAWMEENDPVLLGKDNEAKRERLETLLHSKIPATKHAYDSPKEQWTHSFGSFLKEATAPLLVQSFSEVFHYAPPVLSDLQIRLQAILIYQQLVFFEELENPLPELEEVYKEQERNVSSHLALLSETPADPLAEQALATAYELEAYYNQRHLEAIAQE